MSTLTDMKTCHMTVYTQAYTHTCASVNRKSAGCRKDQGEERWQRNTRLSFLFAWTEDETEKWLKLKHEAVMATWSMRQSHGKWQPIREVNNIQKFQFQGIETAEYLACKTNCVFVCVCVCVCVCVFRWSVLLFPCWLLTGQTCCFCHLRMKVTVHWERNGLVPVTAWRVRHAHTHARMHVRMHNVLVSF